MNRIILIIAFFLSSLIPQQLSAQDYFTKSTDFFVVRVSYGLKSSGVKPEFYAEPIYSTTHPLAGKVTIPDKDILIIKNSAGVDVTITSLGQLMEILAQYGLVLIHTHAIEVLKNPFTEYIFEKK